MSTKAIHNFILTAVCNGDTKLRDHFLDSLAHIVQSHPLEQRIGICLTGPPNTGKSKLLQYIAGMFDEKSVALKLQLKLIKRTTKCVLVDEPGFCHMSKCIVKYLYSSDNLSMFRDSSSGFANNLNLNLNEIRGIIVSGNHDATHICPQRFTCYNVKQTGYEQYASMRNEFENGSSILFLKELLSRTVCT